MGDPLRERFDISSMKETCALTGSGAFASGKYDSFMTPEVAQPSQAVSLEKSGPAVAIDMGGMK